MLERERIIEIVVAVISVLVMASAMMFVGENHTVGGELTSEGGELFVGAVIGFIFLMTAVGIALAFLLNDPEDGLEDTDGSNGEEPSTA